MKRTLRLTKVVVLIVAVMTLNACGGYQATDSDRFAIERIVNDFKFGVENYFIDDMTKYFSDAFVLTLKEGTLEYSKTFAVLKEELESEASDQSYWRSTYGYRLKLELSGVSPLFNDRFASARTSFTVIESATGIDPITTDGGAIDWQFALMGGSWRVTAMTITFNTAGATAAATPVSLPGSPFFQRGSR